MSNIEIKQKQSVESLATSYTITISNVTVGNMLICTFYLRSTLISISDDWVLLGGGTYEIASGSSKQNLYMACKVASSTSESITIKKSSTDRSVGSIVEFSNVSSATFDASLAGYSKEYYSAVSTKPSNAIVYYGLHTIYGLSGTQSTTDPDDLISVINGSDAERLRTWLDDGSGATTHTFIGRNSTDTNAPAGIEGIILTESGGGGVPKYLIKNYTSDGYELLTVDAEGAFQTVPTLEITAETFKTYGFNSVPASDLLVTLSKFDVMLWYDSTEQLPALAAEITATPQAQTVVTDIIDISDYSVSGVEAITATATGSPLFALSFDDKQTWEAWTGSAWATLDSAVSGMTADMMASIAVDQWAAKIAGLTGFHLKFILHDGDTVESVVVDFIN